MGTLRISAVGLAGLIFWTSAWISACSNGTARPGAVESKVWSATKTPAMERAKRRLFDGAPPVIPHPPLSSACISCHNEEGVGVEGLGFSPPSPHELTAGMSSMSRCVQCHVFQRVEEPWMGNTFVGLQQDLKRGSRSYNGAPPVMPHGMLMRENCKACHAGEAAREEIRTSHPERPRCAQCHVEQAVRGVAAFP